ncbi:MAG: eukaryotic-like serine/threonine-protein kinase [Pseudonocardiales bacterium]|nr:eukaryotic-like serine/threonine-protein kinase [Pseudonocardiales bacterium]
MTDVDAQQPALAPATAGEPLAGRYLLGDVLGHGGMGSVYRARDVVLDRDVAVKLFRPNAAAEDAASYEHEARLLAGLSHPGLVTVFDAGIADADQPFLVMELICGATLGQVLGDGPMAPAATAALGAQLATALAYVHRRGIVHRDVKPANILLVVDDDEPGPGPQAKLTDFGIARLVDGARLTADGFTRGTASYLSPEQVRGEPTAAPSDVYSLGLVLLECLTGTVVYPGEGVATATARLHREPEVPESLDAQWHRLLRPMFSRDPARRPGAAEVAVALTGLAAVPNPTAALTEAVAAEAAPPPDSGPQRTQVLEIPPAEVRAAPRPYRPRGGSRRAVILVAAVWVVLIAVVIAVVVGTSGSTSSPAPRPAYPSVTGKLGTDLQHLQQAVQP